MGKTEETYATVISDSIKDGEPVENHPDGEVVGVIVDIKDTSELANFEVIKIVDDKNPYPALLWIDWATDMNGIMNLRKRKMIFEKKYLHVLVPLDPSKGPH